MTWVVPEAAPADEPFHSGEREMLHGFLQHGRETLLLRCAGLTAEQLVIRASPPSGLSLLGIVRHLTDVERIWFRVRFGREDVAPGYRTPENPDSAFDNTRPEQAREDIARYRAEWAAVDSALGGLALGDTYESPRWGVMTLRWAYLHTIREYSAHCGHADLLRERIDGRTYR
jgi:Protein of unknown function (DUF664)